MIQFLRFDGSAIEDSKFSIIEGKESVKFFLKQAGYLILFIYSTLFVAVAIPFVKTPSIPIYFIGGFATAVFLVRLANQIIKYNKFHGGSILLTPNGITIHNKSTAVKIPAADISYAERNLIGNLLIRQRSGILSFPLDLISKPDRESLISLFKDMAPRRTLFFKKIWDFVDAIAVALVLAVHIIQYVIQAYYIPTGSMEDTLQVGDHLFVEKITYGPIIPQMIFMKKRQSLYKRQSPG
jgi:hypothetical protein